MSDATSPPSTRIICILGMHRSGTSLTSRVLNLLGVYLGPEQGLMKPDQFNPKGFWEHQAIVDLDEEILARLGGTWFDPPVFPAGWELSPEFADLRQRARKLIDEDFGKATCWGWKDPRTCLTLPFWKNLLPPLHYVICLRNPADVAKSLAHATSIEKAMRLWHRYTTAALEYSAGRPRMIVFYEDLMENWREESQRLAQIVEGRAGQAAAQSIFDLIEQEVAEELRHHRASLLDVVDEPRLEFPAKALYMALRLAVGLKGMAGDDPYDQQLDDALNAFNRYSSVASEDRVRLEYDLTGYRQRTADLEAIAAELPKRDALLRDARSMLGDQATQIRSQEADCERQRLEMTEQAARITELASKLEFVSREAERLELDLAARDAMSKRLEAVIGECPPGVQAVIREQIAAASARSARAFTAPKAVDRHQYREMIERVRRMVSRSVPRKANVAVISKGDPQLVKLEGRRGWHFPQLEDGTYAGFHPRDSTAAAAELDRIRARSADFLLIPITSYWWLEHYKDFAKQLIARYPVVARDDQTGVIFGLQERSRRESLTPALPTREHSQLARQVRAVVASILPGDAKVLVVSEGDPAFLELWQCAAFHLPPGAKDPLAGSHAADSSRAIAQLEEFRSTGARFLVFPRTASGWLDRYQDFARHLETKYRAVVRQRHVCTIFDLDGR